MSYLKVPLKCKISFLINSLYINGSAWYGQTHKTSILMSNNWTDLGGLWDLWKHAMLYTFFSRLSVCVVTLIRNTYLYHSYKTLPLGVIKKWKGEYFTVNINMSTVGVSSAPMSFITSLFSVSCHCFLQLLIGFESGTIVQWDLRAKKADFRIYYDEVRLLSAPLDILF